MVALIKNDHFATSPYNQFLAVNDICNQNLNNHIRQVALTLVTNDKEFWMKEKVNKICLHPLIGS
jgi:hypothetical protein